MIAYGMLYAAAVGLPILLAAIACSAALRRYGRPERGVWLGALGLALMLPVAFLISAFGSTSPGVPGTLAEAGLPAVASGTIPETGVLGLPSVIKETVFYCQHFFGAVETLLCQQGRKNTGFGGPAPVQCLGLVSLLQMVAGKTAGTGGRQT